MDFSYSSAVFLYCQTALWPFLVAAVIGFLVTLRE